MDSNIEQLERQLSELERTEGTVEVEDEDADEMMEAIDVPDTEDLTLDIVRDLLPDRAEIRDDGKLRAEVVSNHEANTAKLTDTRKEIIEYIHDHPIKTTSAVARALDTADSYIRSTKKDFGFLLRNDALFDYFIVGNGILEDEVDTQEEVERGEDPADVWRVGSQDTPVCEELALPEGDTSSNEESPAAQDDHEVMETHEVEETGATVELSHDEAFPIIRGLIIAGNDDKAAELYDRLFR